MICTTLDEYMSHYGSILAQQAAKATNPLHTPGKDEILRPPLLREPFPAQAHVISAGIKALHRQQAIQIAAEMGTGKTLLSQAICQGHAKGGYRALVFCPPHLCDKWERELRATLSNVHVHHIEGYKSLVRCLPHAPAFGRGWWIVSNTRAKLGTSWEPSCVKGRYERKMLASVDWSSSTLKRRGWIYCPSCHAPLEKEVKGDVEPMVLSDLAKKRHYCEQCGGALWQWNHDIDRWPVAHYIHKHLPGWFDYLVIDESHEAKSAESAVGQAMGSLVAACKKTICLTGTLMGGYAWHVRPLIFRIAPQSLLADGLGWKDSGAFDDKYGRIERRVTETEYTGRSNRQSKGATSKSARYVRPGVMPTLFGKHLIQNTIFLSLDEVADNLPRLDEAVIGCPMDGEMAEEYEAIEKAMREAMAAMLRKKDKRLLSKMLHVLLGYPDHPHGWGEIGYYDQDEESGALVYRHVVTPTDLSLETIRPKEQALIDYVLERKQRDRKVWVFCTMTEARDVNERLRHLLAAQGLNVEVLRSEIETGKRERWIADHGPKNDVIISHPQLVQTGLDLFSKDRSYNFPSLAFYSTGYNLFTLRQAARRHWRIAQWEDCETAYFHYESTMQARAMKLMGDKLKASASIEGKFSSEGLAALAGDEGTLEMALAKSLVERLKDDLDVGRSWQKLGQAVERPVAQQASSLVPQPFVPPIPMKQLDRHVSVSQSKLF